MSKHTEGPWHRNIPPATRYPTIFAGKSTHVAQVVSRLLPPEEVEANCNLIVAAPELLEALEFVLECEMSDWKAQEEFGGYVLDGDVRDRCRAAIAKAKGGTA